MSNISFALIPFPQVKFKEKWHCRPLSESEFRHAIAENYFTAKKFNFGLSKAQVCAYFSSVNLYITELF